MIIYGYNNETDEYEERARVNPDGDVKGDSSLSKDLNDRLSDDGIEHPDGEMVTGGLKLMMLISHRYNNAYNIAEWEDSDMEMLYDELGEELNQ